jgi:hypothetical protein
MNQIDSMLVQIGEVTWQILVILKQAWHSRWTAIYGHCWISSM